MRLDPEQSSGRRTAAEELKRLFGQAIDSLNRDPRVTHVAVPPDYDKHYIDNIISNDDLNDSDSIIQGHSTYLYPQALNTIEFKVHVPKKNQLEERIDEVASEDYIGRWNGAVLMVFWEQGRNDLIPFWGGQIVRTILEDALRSGKVPYDTYGFAFTDFKVVSDQSAAAWFTREDEALVRVAFTGAWNPDEMTDWALLLCNRSADAYFKLINVSVRIRATELVLQGDLVDLLVLQRRRAELDPRRPFHWIRGRWGLLGWRAQARRRMSRMWLASAQIESLRRIWEEELSRSADNLSWTEGVDLFERDVLQERHRVERVSIAFAQQALGYIASRLDTRDVVVATAVGALAGAVVGVLVGHFIAPH